MYVFSGVASKYFNDMFAFQLENVIEEDQSMTDNILDDYERLLLEGPHSDVIFKLKDKTFTSHKSILSIRSRYFAQMFKSSFMENTKNEIVVEEVETSTFEAILLYLYTGLWKENLCLISFI